MISKKIIEHKKLNGNKLRIGIVKAQWNNSITDNLLAGCLKSLSNAGVNKKNIFVLEVPGSFELPFSAQKIIKEKRVDVVIVLGCLIKGETRHDEYIAQAVSQGIMRLGLETGVPVIFGVLTCQIEKQAIDRSVGENNHGYFWGEAGVAMGLLKKNKT
ncbi:MAG: 6,7-dimethyl-8-ribityllumazine synthase [Candidatus Magasanikbacteria bacterium RIFCSPHIGHO2_01_FULL_41_23]|uniref:6,7-dimethyl-8-ribityllumazine synthase n=1 Tax=Candidatus Magasanikbacteria bacterium RIFCSPLOWO2_01_FULL_40_15 TaxID=1798686 RepID=A0A1F6N0F7_9BACT|nr:MAG: 6,7-dimethyl-8-ribityllumazine synthase [Candidatus Magasanikbacteria bacterium RIFCSPHIGHO2_01_FULL_41_23]OGH74648.1 MAG: 6,7-dimethyl-8-ribityllumazine synthase [Candidatus Magasanikbacteria bacterium RIFCSPHIGHO2_12_FULL_41_16]OGH77361.1 MAG: 6,7-dimethyl-8-ribityllumazine synthase [Candidatus Magasanikbacteria bacterium RIFCSPLOWO2_01_FULL_40_15]